MAKDNKVINFKSGSGADAHTIPAALIRLRDASGGSLSKVLSAFFDSSDDALFNMADKAGSNQEQVVYFDAMRELRLHRTRVTRTVLQWVARAFNDIGQFDPQPDSRGLSEVNQESLTLMDTNQLEQKVALDSLISKLRARYAEPIHLLKTRCAYLLPDARLEERQMPLSPEVICTGLGGACRDLDIDIRAKLVIFKLFDRLFVDQLDDVYNEANRLLKAEGVLPELKSGQGTGQETPAANHSRQPPARQQSAQEQPNQRDTDDAAAGGSITFSQLSALLRQDTTSGPYQQKGTRYRIDTPSLLVKLGAAQRSDARLESSGEVVPLAQQLQQVLVSDSGESMGLQQVDGEVINLVSMLFDFILEDRQVPTLMKALIGRLQIPVLKVALCDRGFFNRGGHPARKLLNEMAMAAIGWNEKAKGQRDPLREKIEGIVDRLLNEFTDNVELFAELLEDFSAFMDSDRRRRELVEKRLTDAEEGRARQEEARQAVDNLLKEALVGSDVPKAVESLLLGPWHSYLQWVFLREGANSDLWDRASGLTAQLVWTLDPRPVRASTRSELLKAIPALVDNLRKGLQSISWDPFAIDRAIRDLELAHLDVLQELILPRERRPAKTKPTPQGAGQFAGDEGEIVPEVGQSSAPVPVAPVSEPVAQRPGQAAAVTEAEPSVGIEAEPVNQKFLQHADHLRVGAWIELQGANQRVRCKLAAFIKATDKYIFVNRNGAKVAEYNREELARTLASGDIILLDDGLIFDRALESIIDNLRHSRRD